MKIAYFTDTYYPQISGVTTSIDNFVRELRRRGHTVYIFAPKMKGFSDTDNQTYRLSSFKVFSSDAKIRVPLLIPNKSIKAMFQLDFDIVHAHGNGLFSLLGYEVSRIKRIPYILTFHTLFTKYTHYVFNGKIIKPRMIAAGLKTFANLCDGVITPSEKMKRELLSYGVKKPVTVIPNFIDYSSFRNAKKGFLHRKFHIASSSPILLTVGRLGKEKNFEFIIKMFSKLAKKQLANRKVHLVIVGQGHEEDSLKGLVAKLMMDGQIHFADEVYTKLMPQIYKDATIFVFASVTETQGLVLLEAAAAGLPLITVQDSAFKNIVVNNVNGFLLQLNQNLFIDKIQNLLDKNLLYDRFSKESKKVAEKYFSSKDLTDTLILFYQNTLSRHKKKKMILGDIIQKAVLFKPENATRTFVRFFQELDKRI